MSRTLCILVSEPADPDLDIFTLWVNGHGVKEATEIRADNEPSVTKEFHDYKPLLLSETQEQFRMFELLQPYLQLPQTFMNQHLFQLSHSTKRAMIENYYAFDEPVVREFLGKKLSSKNRKDLDNISEKTGVPLKSCRRQFDNIKQVLRVVDVDDPDGLLTLLESIKLKFILPEKMARVYASVVFISANRFETNKKKLSLYSFSDFTSCAGEMINHWTAGSEGSLAVDDDLELDRDFLQDLHDLKLSMLGRIWVDRHLKLVVKDMRRRKLSAPFVKSVEQNFRALSKALVSLGASLVRSKDLKDFFVDLVEDVVEPCKSFDWTREDVNTVLTSMGGTMAECEQAHSKQTGRPDVHEKLWSVVYNRYLQTLKYCIMILYR
jgi:hypothetical protein